MVKTLENNVKGKTKKDWLKRAKIGASALLVAASLSYGSCKPFPDPTPSLDPTPTPTPNYPAIYLDEVNVTQGENKTINLSELASESGINWTGIGEYDSRLLTPTINGNNLTVQVSENISEDTPYSINCKFNRGNGEETGVLEGTIKNLFDVYGTLQDNETQTNKQGLVKLFDSSNTKIGETSTTDGNFHVKSTIPHSGKVKLQAKLDDGSYVRTMEFDGTKDVSDSLVRAVPYPTFDTDNSGAIDETDYQNFYNFIKQIGTTSSVELINGNYITVNKIFKWNLDNLAKIEICRTNSDNGTYFTQEEIDSLISYMPEIKKFIAGKKDLSSIVQVLENTSDSHKMEPGYIVVMPDDYIGTKGNIGLEESNYQDPNNSRIVTTSLIHLLPIKSLPVSKHEFGHSFIAQELTNETVHKISPDYTIMYSDGSLLTPGVADEKAGKLLYEETYSAGDKIEDILGFNFL
jgi:hypothetical protein